MTSNKLIIAGIALAAALPACNDGKPQDSEQSVLIATAPEVERETAYTGEGKIVKREVKVDRVWSPFGISPGEAISRQQPMSIQEGPSPGINISPTGIETTGNGGGITSTGGFKWSFLDNLWGSIKRLAWIGLFAGGGLLALYLIPATKPIAAAIGKFFSWLIPLFGGMIEAIKGKFAKQQFTQVVDGGEEFKAALAASGLLTDEQKAAVKAMFTANQKAAQDKSTQTAVKTVTG